MADEEKTEWTRGALWALALSARWSDTAVRAGLAALGISKRAQLEATGADEQDLAPLLRILWGIDKPVPPTPGAWMVAHDTGDGWYLHWTDDNADDLGEIAWPFGGAGLTARDLEDLGFEVV